MTEKEIEYSEQGYRCPECGPDYPWVMYNFVTRESFCGRCRNPLEKRENEEKWIELNAMDAIVLTRDYGNAVEDVEAREKATEKMNRIISCNDRWSLKKLLDIALCHHDDEHITFRRDDEE